LLKHLPSDAPPCPPQASPTKVVSLQTLWITCTLSHLHLLRAVTTKLLIHLKLLGSVF
jgi:hypothetical protein